MKYGHIEKGTNKLLGWYDTDIHSSIPKPNVKITDDEHLEYINANVNYYNKESKKFEVKDFSTFDDKINTVLNILKSETTNYIYTKPSTILDIDWVGGYESAQMLNAKRSMCVELGLDRCTFTDSNDEDWNLTLAEATEVCLKVAKDFEDRRAKYKEAKRAIENSTSEESIYSILDTYLKENK